MKILILLMFAGWVLFSCGESDDSKITKHEIQEMLNNESENSRNEIAKDFFNEIVGDLKPVIIHTDSLIEKIKRFDDSESIRSFAQSNPAFMDPGLKFKMKIVPDINDGGTLKEKAENLSKSSYELFSYYFFLPISGPDWQKVDSLVSSYYNNYDEFQEYQHVFMKKNQ